MCPEAILICWLVAPLLIALRRAQIKQHDRDTVSRALTGAHPSRGQGTHVRESKAFAAIRTAPGPGATEERLRTAGGENPVGGARLPCIVGHATAGALVAAEVIMRGGRIAGRFGAGPCAAAAGGLLLRIAFGGSGAGGLWCGLLVALG